MAGRIRPWQPNGLPRWPTGRRRSTRSSARATCRSSRRAVTVDDRRRRARTFAPRVGFAFDLAGNNRTVLEDASAASSATTPPTRWRTRRTRSARASCGIAFNDLNGNRILDGPQELGTFHITQGGGGFVTRRPEPRHGRTSKRSPPASSTRSRRASRAACPMSTRTSATSGRRNRSVARGRDTMPSRCATSASTAWPAPATTRSLTPRGSSGEHADSRLSPTRRTRRSTAISRPSSWRSTAASPGRWMLLTSFAYTWLDQIHAAA